MVELMVTLSVAAILAVVSVPSFTNMIVASEMRSAATTVALAMTKARSEASKRGATVTVTPNSGDWAKGWVISTADDPKLLIQQPIGSIAVSNVPTVEYLSSGRVRNFDPAKHKFELTSQRQKDVQRCVSIDVSGASSVEEGACS